MLEPSGRNLVHIKCYSLCTKKSFPLLNLKAVFKLLSIIYVLVISTTVFAQDNSEDVEPMIVTDGRFPDLSYSVTASEFKLIAEERVGIPYDDFPSFMKECMEKGRGNIEAITETFKGPEKKADCRPASLPGCRTKTNSADLSYVLEGPWKIDGDLSIRQTSANGGNKVGFSGPRKLDDRTVSASAHCRGEGCGGGGNWIKGYVQGTKRRIVTEDDARHIVGYCLEEYGKSKLLDEVGHKK